MQYVIDDAVFAEFDSDTAADGQSLPSSLSSSKEDVYKRQAVFQLIGGIRSGMGYCGARDIAALQRAQFIRITSNGVTENHPHDVTPTEYSSHPDFSLTD